MVNNKMELEFDDDDEWCTDVNLQVGETVPQPPNGDEQEKTKEPKNCVNMTKEDVDNFIEGQENMNTRRKTVMDTQRFEVFLRSKGELREINKIPTDELDTQVANFVLSVRRNDGTEYEPTTLRSIVGSIDRKLKRMRYQHSIFATNDKFLLTKDALKAKSKFLKKQGKGNRANAAQAITDEEITTLYDKGLLGTATPESLLNTLWFNNSMHFGMRGIEENYQLR